MRMLRCCCYITAPCISIKMWLPWQRQFCLLIFFKDLLKYCFSSIWKSMAFPCDTINDFQHSASLLQSSVAWGYIYIYIFKHLQHFSHYHSLFAIVLKMVIKYDKNSELNRFFINFTASPLYEYFLGIIHLHKWTIVFCTQKIYQNILCLVS